MRIVANDGFTVWLTGLPGAGKTTLARALRDEVCRRGRRVEILDGDEIRTTLSANLGFSKTDRDTNVRRIGFVARLLSRNGIVAIAALVSPYRETRKEVRSAQEAPFVEVYVHCSLEALVQRDGRGLYRQAIQHEIEQFTGISDPYEPPEHPDVMVCTDRQTLEQSLAAIVAELERRQLLTLQP